MLSFEKPFMKTSILTSTKRAPHLLLSRFYPSPVGLLSNSVGKAAFLLAFAMFWTICSLAAEGISESALAQIRAFQQEKAARTPAQQKLDSQIVYAIRQGRNELSSFGITNVHPNLRLETDRLLLVDIDATVTPVLLSQITQSGGLIVNSSAQFHSIRARIPLSQAESLAVAAGVKA